MALKNIYTVDWIKLVIWLTPTALRMPNMLAFLAALVTPVNSLYNVFINHAYYTDYWLHINGQVCFLEKALNDRYDKTVRGIYIDDAPEKDPLPLYQSTENKPVVFYTKEEGMHQVLYTKAETAQFTVDFIVFVPASVLFDLNEMTALINSIKLPSKTFKVQVI